MKNLVKAVAVLAALCLVLLGGSASVAAGKKADRVGAVSAADMQIRIDAAKGRDKWRAVTPRTRVFVRTKAGERVRADLNALARGAAVKAAKLRRGEVKAITLAAKGATGATDCSFDSSDDDGDSVEDGDSFDCSHDYDDGTVDTESDCSYDSSADGPGNDFSMDVSWDCSYSETDETDESDEDGLDWDCSFDASAGGESDEEGSEVEAELEFECSWSGADTDAALWDCHFVPDALGFECTSSQLDQNFGYTIDTVDMAFDGGMDFQSDLVEDGDSDDDVQCSGSPAGGYDCSVEGESSRGDCEVEWEFERSRGSREGEVAGALSYACATDD